jgi:hypothetical protein
MRYAREFHRDVERQLALRRPIRPPTVLEAVR